MQVETIKGPIDTSELGVTLMHEHLFFLSEGVHQAFPSIWGPEAQKAAIGENVRLLKDLASRGVQTVVDCTVFGEGRRIDLLQQVAQQAPVNIVVATGVYTFDPLPHYFLWPSRDPDHMASLLVRDIEQGIGDTGVKASILKCATDQIGVTPNVEKVLRATARAHLRTGVPIYTHTHAATEQGLAQQAIFKEEGVDLGRVIIGHAGDSEDVQYLMKLVEAGSYIGMDRWGIDMFLPFEKRVAMVAKMCELGYAERMVQSHDFCYYVDAFPMEERSKIHPRWSHNLIFEEAIPALREAGVTDAQIHQMMVENPRKIFQGR